MEEMLKEMKGELKELKEDRKHDREMIVFLKDRILQAERNINTNQNEELGKKLDLILDNLRNTATTFRITESSVDSTVRSKIDGIAEKLEHLKDLERKVDHLREELEKSQKTVTYFLESHEDVNWKMEMLKTTMDNLELEKVDKLVHIDQKTDLIARGLDELHEEINIFPNMFLELQEKSRLIEIALSSQELEFEELRRDLAEKMLKPLEHKNEGADITYKCFNLNCQSVFPKNVHFEEDGISAECQNKECEVVNILGHLNPGNKWMYTVCNGVCHYQQFPFRKKNKGVGQCQICGKEGTVTEATNTALIAGETTKSSDRKKIGKVSSILKRNSSKAKAKDEFYICWNGNCKFVFHKNYHLREDGVSVACPRCHHIPILGKLDEGHRWMSMYCNGKSHYQQFPAHTKHREVKKCGICEVQGETYGANDHVAIRQQSLD